MTLDALMGAAAGCRGAVEELVLMATLIQVAGCVAAAGAALALLLGAVRAQRKGGGQ